VALLTEVTRQHSPDD